jgi:iron complex transport system substrate-binding protein
MACLLYVRKNSRVALLLACLLANGAFAQSAPQAATRQAFVDDLGRVVEVRMPVQRIVALAPSVTETLYALGAQDRLAGVTDFCDFPPEAKQKPRVGGALSPNIEQIVALRPDLVILTKSLNRIETLHALEQLSIPVYATHAASVAEILESTRRLGAVVAAPEVVQALIARMQARLAELKWRLDERVPRRVFFVVWTDPLVTIGPQSFLADALRWAGAESVVQVGQEWPRLSLEELVRLQPEYLVFAESHSETVESRAHDLAARQGWRNLQAVRRNRIALISDAVNRPSPRILDAVEELARRLHPDAFLVEAQQR